MEIKIIGYDTLFNCFLNNQNKALFTLIHLFNVIYLFGHYVDID